jgi:hypothetical protein
MASERRMTKAEVTAVIDFNRELVERAQHGDKQALAQAKQMLAAHPELWRRAQHLTAQVEKNLVHAICHDDELGSGAIKHQAAEMRRTLAGDKATPIECLIAEQIVLCWLHLRHMEGMHHGNCFGPDASRTLSQLNHWERLVARAEGRYLRALRTLAQVRRLPTVQVNVDARRVHVERPSAASSLDSRQTAQGQNDKAPQTPFAS